MQRLGLSDGDLRIYNRNLTTTHERRIHVDVMDLDFNHLAHLTPKYVGGQVNIDTTGGPTVPTRILDMQFLDTDRAVHFEPKSPLDAPIHRSRVVRITDSRRVPALGDWVDCEVFTGVVWDFRRVGAMVSLVAHGMERQALGQVWKPMTFRKHTKKTTAIKELLAAAGENHLGGIPDLDRRMPERMTVTRMDSEWPRAVRLGDSMDRQLFYPGTGRPVLRLLGEKPVFTFGDRHLLSDVEIDRPTEGVFNTFVVVGAKAKGAKKRPMASAQLPEPHDLSPESLARNQQPHHLVKREEIRQVKDDAEAKARAKRLVDRAKHSLVGIQFDTIPVPHLDELDMVAVRSTEGTLKVRMERWSLPLDCEGAPPMTVGDVRRTTTRKGGN
jgi:hypothetical protein